jgi:hypothetical protein
MVFLHANKRFGRHDIDSIAKEVRKSVDEVRRYAESFWTRGRTEIEGWPKLVAVVEKGEASLRETLSLHDALAAKVCALAVSSASTLCAHDSCCSLPSATETLGCTLKLLVTSKWDSPRSMTGARVRLFSSHVTQRQHSLRRLRRFLLCKTQELGALDGEHLRREVLRFPRFRFDHVFRSRSAHELRRRAETLLRACERDLLDSFAKEERKATTAAGVLRAAEEESAQQLKRLEAEKDRLTAELAVVQNRAQAAQLNARAASANPSLISVVNGKYVVAASAAPPPGAQSAAPSRAQPAVASKALPAASAGPNPAAPEPARASTLSAVVARPIKNPLPDQVMPVFARIVSEAGALGQRLLVSKVASVLVGASARQVLCPPLANSCVRIAAHTANVRALLCYADHA